MKLLGWYHGLIVLCLIHTVPISRAVAQEPGVDSLQRIYDSVRVSDSLQIYTRVSDKVRQEHTIHVSPHLIVFDPVTRSMILELQNIGDKVLEGDVMVQLGFTYWQNVDTALIPTRGKNLRGHDTVIFSPNSSDHYAGAWLVGVPSHLALKPHETRRVQIRIDPPANLPDGEYYARIITSVASRVKRSPVSGDTKEILGFPIKGWDLPRLRDSVRVFYRKGPQSMGVKLVRADAEVDSADFPKEDVGPHPLRILLQLQRTGTAHGELRLDLSYVNENGDEDKLVASEGAGFALHRDGIMRWSAETYHLPPGRYHLLIKLSPNQNEFPETQRIPMQQVTKEIPFDVPEYATQVEAMPLISTGSHLEGGKIDPYWHYIPRPVDYNAPNALTERGTSIVVMSTTPGGGDNAVYNHRAIDPAKNFNNGWASSRDNFDDSEPLGFITRRTFVDLSLNDVRHTRIAGMWWVDDCLHDIFVNGIPLQSFTGRGLCDGNGWTTGFPFSIGVDDGLVDGVNVLDFDDWNTDGGYGGYRVDFKSFFRETHDR